MKKLQLAGLARAMFATRRAWVFGAAMAMAGAAHAAPVEIQVWYTLPDANKAEFEKLAKQYNKEQDQVRVNLRDKVLSEATLAWFGENNNSVDAYLNITDPDFKMNITSFGGYKGKLPAGMRNNNPGNIKYVGQKDAVGPSKNTDQGDAQAVYATAEDGMAAMYNLLMKKYAGGKVTTMQIIAEAGGWTPAINSTAAEKNRVTQIANYGLKDGKIFDFISRTTPTAPKDQSFLAQIIKGAGKMSPGSAGSLLGGS